jgi:hypothetical protein
LGRTLPIPFNPPTINGKAAIPIEKLAQLLL